MVLRWDKGRGGAKESRKRSGVAGERLKALTAVRLRHRERARSAMVRDEPVQSGPRRT